MKMYDDSRIHKFIDKILSSFYVLKLWNARDETSLRVGAIKWLQLLYFASFVLSMAGGACMSTDTDEIIFLTVAAMINGVIVYRMAIIIGRRSEIRAFVKELGRHAISDENDFTLINGDVEYFIKFAKAFVVMCVAGVTFALFVPLISSGKKLVFNIALPAQWKGDVLVFWIAHIYSVVGCLYSTHSLLLCVIIWYLMVNSSLKYKTLGNRLKKLGVEKGLIFRKEKREVLLREIVSITATHLSVNNTIDQFASCFGNLFFLQISTSGICITGSIYTLAFSSERNILQNGIYCVFISYSFFDIFTLMFLGNELKLSSDRLSYCLFESDWIENAHLDRTSILILGEVLRQPREMVVGRVYPLNLKTFTKILNGAYSMFNILKTVK